MHAQPTNDFCIDPINIELEMPASCPATSVVSDTIHLSNADATASNPFPELAACSGGGLEAGADVWLQFTALGNSIKFEVRGDLDFPQLALFQGNSCTALYPVACASGNGSLELIASLDRNQSYYLMVSGQGHEDQGDFELIITSTNFCNPCVLDRRGFFSATPAPVNGTYPGGQTVEMCYTVDRWNAGASGEYLHALELDFGDGWDATSFVPMPPSSCSDNGNWAWYDNWTSISSNQQFGPGFAYDANDFGFLDGNPGNNRGMGGNLCSNIGITSDPLQFCWTITTKDCPEGSYGYFDALDVTSRMLGDGLSGSWGQTQCYIPSGDLFLSTTYCPDPVVPEITVQDASCYGDCDGVIYASSTGQGPWDYTLSDTDGTLIYNSSNNTAPDTISDLCVGDYIITIADQSSGEVRTESVSITAGEAPTATASYELPCYDGEPIQLSGTSSPIAGASYEWFGPNDFYSTNQNPLALYPGTYVLITTVDGCSSEPFVLEVPPIDIPVVSIGPDTIITCPDQPLTITATGTATSFTWFLQGGNNAIGTGPSITVTPEDGTIYQVNGTNDQGCAGSDYVYVKVPFQPSVTTDIQGLICPFTEVNITASGGNEYNWSTGETTASITVAPEYTSLYHVTITGNICTQVLTVNIAVSNSPSLFISPDANICQGESTSLFAGGGESVLWSTGETTSSITVTPDMTTTYTAEITDDNGCIHEKNVTVTVFPSPDLTIVPTDPAICEGDSITLLVLEGGSLYWDTLVAPNQTTSYTIPGAAFFGCQELGTITVEVYPIPAVAIIGDDLICGADSTLLVAQGDGTFTWSAGETGDSIYINPVGTATYSVTATTTQGCTQTDSVTVTQADAPAAPVINCEASLSQVNFSWTPDPSLTYGLSLVEGPPGVPIGSGLYVVMGLSPEQTVTVELTVTNAEGCSTSVIASCTTLSCEDLSLSVSTPDELCIGDDPVALAANVDDASATGIGIWSGAGIVGDHIDPALAGAGQHEIIYTYIENTCVIADTATINVIPVLTADMVNCEASGSTITFSWPSLPADTTYEVIVISGQDGSFLNDTTFVVDSLMNGDTATINIVSLGNETCGSTVVEVSCFINNCPPLEIVQDTFACAGDPVQLWADSINWDNFTWSPNVTLSCTDCASPVAYPSQTTTYTVVATNSFGCTDTASVTIYIGEIPPSYIPDEPITFCIGEPFEICMPEGDIEIWIGPNGLVSTGSCLSIDNMTSANEGNYYAFLRIGDCRLGKLFKLEAAPAIEITNFTDFQTVCADSAFILGVEATNVENYWWEPAEYLVCPDCAETYGSVPQTATFTLTLTDAYGCSVTEVANVFVNDCLPDPAIDQPDNGILMHTPAVQVYPNPANQLINLVFEAVGTKQIELYNASGQLAIQQEITDIKATIDISMLTTGVYLLRSITSTGIQTQWIVISR